MVDRHTGHFANFAFGDDVATPWDSCLLGIVGDVLPPLDNVADGNVRELNRMPYAV